MARLPRRRNYESYEEEQEALRAEAEGRAPDDALRIEVPKEPEVNPAVYKDVEPMLFRGFLAVSARFENIHIVFKSLNHHEFSTLAFAGDFGENAPGAHFWNLFLAHAVFMFDGQNVLADRDRWIPRLTDVFENLPIAARDRVVRHLSELNRRSTNAIHLTEAFATESQSRYRWTQLRGVDLTSVAVTGIPGTERLGMNWAQLAWRALNTFEDTREQMERDWENAKFIGSCFAGKGLSRVYNQDNERRQKEKEERFARKDALLRHVLLGEALGTGLSQKYGAQVVAARTVEELAEQMEMNIKGEKDWHDYVVQQHEQHARDAQRGRQDEVQKLVAEREREFEGRYLRGGTDLQGLTPKEVQERIAHHKTWEAQQAARRIVYPVDEKEEGFQRKWLLGDEGVDAVETTDRDPQEAVPMRTEPLPRATPFRR